MTPSGEVANGVEGVPFWAQTNIFATRLHTRYMDPKNVDVMGEVVHETPLSQDSHDVVAVLSNTTPRSGL